MSGVSCSVLDLPLYFFASFAGLFEPSHMDYELDRDNSSQGEPSIKEMTRKAIEVLQRGDRGFFLMVEGRNSNIMYHSHDKSYHLYLK